MMIGWNEDRIDIIGSNGNDGDHYDQVDLKDVDIPNRLDDGLDVRVTNLKQIGGDHYVKHTIQPWAIIEEYNLDFWLGNVQKYILRDKGDTLEDLQKARHYLDKKISLLENK
jgi:hypothetical protein